MKKFEQPIVARGDIGEFSTGMMDCVFGLIVALERAGTVSRSEVADAFEDVIAQQKGMTSEHVSGARQYPVKYLHRLLRTPVVSQTN